MTVYSRNTYNVDAIQYTGSNQSALRDFGVTFTTALGVFVVTVTDVSATTDADSVVCAVGDYIVKSAGGNISVMAKADFEAKFTVVP